MMRRIGRFKFLKLCARPLFFYLHFFPASPHPARKTASAPVTDPTSPPHPATSAALVHTAQALKVDLTTEWLPTEPLAAEGWQHRLEPFHGFLIGPGRPYNSLQRGLDALRFARESCRSRIATRAAFPKVV